MRKHVRNVDEVVRAGVMLTISKYKLDDDAVTVDAAFAKAVMEAADATSARDKAKRRAEVKLDEVFLDIKRNFKDYDFEKAPSDGMAKSAANVHPEYKALYMAYLDAAKVCNEWKSLVAVLEHKTSAIKTETQLHSSQYFAINPRIKGDDDFTPSRMGTRRNGDAED